MDKNNNQQNLYFCYWGKAKPTDSEAAQYHLLPYHCLDVAAVAALWWDISPVLKQQFGYQTNHEFELPILRAWVLFFIALHDLGKLDVRFQLKNIDVLFALFKGVNKDDLPSSNESNNYYHGEAGYDWFLKEWCFYLDLSRDQHHHIISVWKPWMGAVAGHHGKIVRQANVLYLPDAEEWIIRQDFDARKAWIKTLESLFLKPVGLSLQNVPPTLEWQDVSYLAGFCAICDWLGSNELWFPYVNHEYQNDLKAYFDERYESIKKQNIIAKCGLSHPVVTYQGVATLLNENELPRQLQTLVDFLPLQVGLTLVEAPTGSGKTETALAYAWRLLDANLVDSIVFALPTQATANAMWDRLNAFADRIFGASSNLVLAHGRARWHEGHAQLKQAAAQISAQNAEDIRVQCSEWIAESRKRVFLGQIGICTIDQVLLSVLPLRHKFVRGFGVMKSMLIIDEVHAYDHYMYGLLHSVLSQQRRAGGSALLLSATLPASQRNQLAHAWGSSCSLSSDEPYPLLTHITSCGQLTPIPIMDSLQLPDEKTVFIECIQQVNFFPTDDLLDRVIQAAEIGACVVIICNLVDVAQKLAQQLGEKTLIPVDLFHARYRFLDRQEKEKNVLAQYGRAVDRIGGRILVATQVVEQSLDLDFDWMITQLCPIDLLFQRLGRLHRHEREWRPLGFEKPCCTILTAPENDYGLHKLIYGNTRWLWRTQQLLEAHQTIQFPVAYRSWVERVYERDDWENEPESISLDFDQFYVEEKAKQDEAKKLSNDTINPFSDNDSNIRALTRDGEMSLSVVLLDGDDRLLYDSQFLSSLDEWDRVEKKSLGAVSVPNSWQKKLNHVPIDEQGNYLLNMTQINTQYWIYEGGGIALRYSQIVGLEKIESEDL